MQYMSLETPTEQHRPNPLFASSAYQLIAVTLCVVTALSYFFLPLPTFQWFSDYWEPASALRVLSESIVAPTNPHYATYDSDRQFIPLYALMGYLMNITGMAVTTAMALCGVLTMIVFCVGVKMFANAYYRHRWAPAVLLAVLLCCWGTPWVWVGFYEFRALFYNGFYPATFVLGLTFITWAIVIQAMRDDAIRIVHWWALPTLAALMFVSHQLGGVFAMGAIALFLLFEPGSSVKTRVSIFMLLAVGLAVTWWWPYFNPITLTYYGSGDKENEGVPDFYNFLKVVLLIGPAWLGIPVLVGMARKRMHVALIVGALAIFCAYLVGGMLNHPVAHRFLSYSVLYLHLIIVWKLLSMIPDQDTWPGLARLRQERRSNWIWLVAIVFVAFHLGVGVLDSSRILYEKITGKPVGSFPHQNVIPELMAVVEKLPENAIMFATVDPALSVKAYKGKVIARPRPQLMIADGAARNRDNARFFARPTSQVERRTLIRKYGATHILIREENVAKQVTQDLQALGEVVPTSGSLILVKIDNARTH